MAASAACRRTVAQPVHVVEEEDDERHQRDLGEEIEAASGGEDPETRVSERPLDVLGLELGLRTCGLADRNRRRTPRSTRRRPRRGSRTTPSARPPSSRPGARAPRGLLRPESPSAGRRARDLAARAGNHCITARPLAALTLAPSAAGDAQQERRAAAKESSPARRGDEDAAGAPGRSRGRSARRSGRRAAPRAEASAIGPIQTLESAIPTSVSDRSYRSRRAGASTGEPDQDRREARLRRRPRRQDDPAVPAV